MNAEREGYHGEVPPPWSRGHAESACRMGQKGQGLVEFMLVLPVLMLLVLGIIEAGRMLLIYSGVTSASRYGASVDDNGTGTMKYLDCDGMRAAARRLAAMSTLADGDIQIVYDHGDISQPIASCDDHPAPSQIALGDRVVITVTTTYTPIVPLVPIPPMPITSVTARTILKEVGVGPTSTLAGPTNTPASATETPAGTTGATATSTSAVVPTDTPPATVGPTETPANTNTPLPTPTEIPVPQNFSA